MVFFFFFFDFFMFRILGQKFFYSNIFLRITWSS